MRMMSLIGLIVVSATALAYGQTRNVDFTLNSEMESSAASHIRSVQLRVTRRGDRRGPKVCT